MPLILCIETATRLCSVALGRDGVLLAERGLESDKHIHAEKLNVFIAEAMEEAGVSMRELDAVAVGIGPGSYTGLRIGLSAAKGLCFALGIPIIGIGTLGTLVTASSRRAPRMLPMIDARRMEVFTQPFDGSGNPLGDAHPLVLDEAWADGASESLVVGDGADKAVGLWARYRGLQHLPGVRPHARCMLAAAHARLAAGLVDDLAYLVPLYGKEAHVTQPGKRRERG